MKKVCITQSNYIPWKGFFDSINIVDEIILYDDMQYTKRDWRNRNKIKTQQGAAWLTIPVEVKGKYFQKINETKINDKEWNLQHWRTIVQNYSKADFFNGYKDFFEQLYLGCTTDNLSEINYRFLKAIGDLLEIKTTFKWSHDFQLLEGKTERLVDLCKKVGATEYYSGPAAKNYIDEAAFENEGIKVCYFDFTGYPPYRQLNGDFTHEVSVIDLLFNEGPNAKKYMKSFNLQ